MLLLPILRNHPRLHLNLCRRLHAHHRHPDASSSPRPAEAKDDPNYPLRYGNLRHRRRRPEQGVLSRPISDFLRLHELVLPRSNRRHPSHQSAASLVPAP